MDGVTEGFMRKFLMKKKYLFSQYKFYRKWHGGKWKLCYTSLCMHSVWLLEHEHCGCLLKILDRESY